MEISFVSPCLGLSEQKNVELFCIYLLPVAMASSPVQGLAKGWKSSWQLVWNGDDSVAILELIK